jgi:hypothetical protein
MSCVVDFLTEARSKTRLVFGSSFFWLPHRWYNLLSCNLYHSHDTCNIVVCLSFIHDLIPGLNNLLFGCAGLFWCQSFVVCDRAIGAKNFLPVFRWPVAIRIDAVDMLRDAVIVVGAWSTFVISSGL